MTIGKKMDKRRWWEKRIIYIERDSIKFSENKLIHLKRMGKKKVKIASR